MYRPPEMCDPFLGFEVCEKVDIWMLGIFFFKKKEKLMTLYFKVD